MSIPNKMPPFDNNKYVSAYCEGRAARDKDWIKWFDDLTIGCDGGWGTDCAGKPIILDISIEQWQSLKLSLQSSVALTNIMGKFPDLPDVEEDK
jgi:hypothetical protein